MIEIHINRLVISAVSHWFDKEDGIWEMPIICVNYMEDEEVGIKTLKLSLLGFSLRFVYVSDK